MNATTELTIGQCATLACLLEVAAPKPGNVHRGADFADMTLGDFLASAVAIGPILDGAVSDRLGRTVLAAVRQTRSVTSANTNLGLILLLAPLAAVPRAQPLSAGVQSVLNRLDAQDAQDVYHAIRLAAPGGLDPQDGPVREYDVRAEAPESLQQAMRQAADRDLIARQYDNGFVDVLQCALPRLLEFPVAWPLSQRIVHLHIWLMSEFPDSLIARKCGQQVALESAARAAGVLEAGPIGSPDYWRAAADLDFWLRCDGNRRNPGTTADLIAAALFAGLREGSIGPPFA